MILILDNYDSFTYNLVQYIGSMNPNIQVSRNDQITINDIKRLLPERIVILLGQVIQRMQVFQLKSLKSLKI